MEPAPCMHCQVFFVPRNKAQTYCSAPECQRARKAKWQRDKLASDPEYRAGQKLAKQKWARGRPDYWTEYREKHPDKTDRNRALQKVRDQKRRHEAPGSKETILAKMDARKPCKQNLSGEFWLVPVLAKMDAVKILFAEIQDG